MSLVPELLSRQVALVSTSLAQQPGPGDQGGQGEDFGKSSPLGLLVLILFLIAVVFLVRSMTKHLKRVPASFDDSETGGEVEASDPKAAAGASEEDSVTQTARAK